MRLLHVHFYAFTTLTTYFQINSPKQTQCSSHISKDWDNHRLASTQKKNITLRQPNVNHPRTSLADQISQLFLLTISLVHQHQSLVVMRAVVKRDPRCRKTPKGKSENENREKKKEESKTQRKTGTLLYSALLCLQSTTMCDLRPLNVFVGNHTCQFQQTGLWGVAGRKWEGARRNNN